MKIAAFVDYDNLLDVQKNKGFFELLSAILLRVQLDTTKSRAECSLRVYGGWYEGSSMTPLAQRVDAELQREFPDVIQCRTKDGNPIRIKTTGEIACSLIQKPETHLIDTVRTKGAPSNLRITSAKSYPCVENPCGLNHLHKFFKKRKCPILGCGIKINDVVERREQKIVDTLLTCDIVYASHAEYDTIILISSDDDFLPSLITASFSGKQIARIHTKPIHGRDLQTAAYANLTEHLL